LVVLFELAMITVVVADDLFVLLVGWEVMGICSYLLIGHHWELPAAREGAVKAFVMTRLGDLGLLIGIFVLGGTFGTFSISTILDRIGRGAEPGQLTAAGLLLLCAVVGKSAQFPLHTWLPDAMPGPTPISALIHAATMVAAGVYLVARLYPVFAASAVTMTALAVIACVSMLLAALFALAQSDLKRVLAWSTVSQLAYMFAALAVGGSDAGIAHLLSHGSFKALLFLAAGCVAHAVGSTTLTSMGGLRTAMPVTFVTATIGFAALAGVVPTSGFLTKDAVLSSAVHATQHPAPVAAATAWLVLLVGLLTAVVTVVYSTRTWLLVFFGTREPRAQMHESPVAMTGPLVALAVATLALGATQSWHPALGVLTTLIAVGGVAGTVAYWRRGRDPAELLGASRDLFARELGVDGAYDGLAAGVGRTGDFTVAADTDVIDAYPRGTAVVAVTGSRLLDRLQTGNVQTYAVVFGAGALLVVLAVVAW
ncbi:MAG: NADH-quinone oxidoreductase subunit 5 family protein, partial [Nocardioidaceae bacterium]